MTDLQMHWYRLYVMIFSKIMIQYCLSLLKNWEYLFWFIFLFSKLGKGNSDFSFCSQNCRNCFKYSRSLLEWTFLPLVNHCFTTPTNCTNLQKLVILENEWLHHSLFSLSTTFDVKVGIDFKSSIVQEERKLSLLILHVWIPAQDLQSWFLLYNAPNWSCEKQRKDQINIRYALRKITGLFGNFS